MKIISLYEKELKPSEERLNNTNLVTPSSNLKITLIPLMAIIECTARKVKYGFITNVF